MTLTPQLKTYLENQGYCNLKEIPGRGICGLSNFMFTTGIIYGMTNWTYKGRYCYGTAAEAETALKHWTGEGHPPGLWIKHKGDGVEESNPLNKQNAR